MAGSEADVLAAMDRPDGELARIGRAARERVLDEHTSDHRAGQLLALLADISEGVLPTDYTPAAYTPATLEV